MELIALLSDALQGAPWIALLAALGWGFASIWLSPCHLAGVPLVVGYLSTASSLPVRHGRLIIIFLFALGSLLSLIPVGGVTLLMSRVAGDLGFSSNYLVALLCIVAGLYLLGWLQFPWSGPGLRQLSSRRPHAALSLGLLFGIARALFFCLDCSTTENSLVTCRRWVRPANTIAHTVCHRPLHWSTVGRWFSRPCTSAGSTDSENGKVWLLADRPLVRFYYWEEASSSPVPNEYQPFTE